MAEGAKVGFPVLVKAALGGGDKGMKLAMQQDELEVCFYLLQDLEPASNICIVYSFFIMYMYYLFKHYILILKR